MDFRVVCLLLIILALVNVASASCVGDDDCNGTQFCNSTLECQDQLSNLEICDRDRMCADHNCFNDICLQNGHVCYGDRTFCAGNGFNCISGTCVINLTLYNITEFNGVETTNLLALDDYDSANFTLHKGNTLVSFRNVDLGDVINFGAHCEFADWWAYCDSTELPQVDTMAAQIEFRDNNDWMVKLLSGLNILRDGFTCPSSVCTNFTKSGDDVMFNVTGFSNYTVTNTSDYDAVINDLICPEWVYVGTEDAPRHMSIMFDIMNTRDEYLQGISCDLFIFSDEGILIEDLKTRMRDDETIENITRWIPITDSRGRYMYEWEITDRDYFSGHNYTVRALCAALQTNCTFEVRGYMMSNQDDEIEYYQSAMQDIVIGLAVLIAVLYMAVTIYQRSKSGSLYS